MDKNRTFTPTVITSKKAQKDLNRIRARHSDILSNLQVHQEKVKAYKEQKEAERKANLQVLIESRKQKIEQDAHMKQESQKHIAEHQKQVAQQQKEARDHEIKMKEL